MEHLILKGKCSLFHNIFKYKIFQRHQKALLWSKGLKESKLNYPILAFIEDCPDISVVEEVQEDVTGSKVSVRSASKDNIKDNTEKVPFCFFVIY